MYRLSQSIWRYDLKLQEFNFSYNCCVICISYTYTTYGPLCLSEITVLLESTFTCTSPSRFWYLFFMMIFFITPTAIHKLAGGHADLSSPFVIESVGELVNYEAWGWHYEKVKKFQYAVVVTCLQTETVSVISPLPKAITTSLNLAQLLFPIWYWANFTRPNFW